MSRIYSAVAADRMVADDALSGGVPEEDDDQEESAEDDDEAEGYSE